MAADRRTKIVATLGPASDSRERLRALIAAGVDAVRFNLSHGAHDDHSQRAWLVRELAAEIGRPVALIADLQGPKLRIGELAEPVVLHTGDRIKVCAEEACRDGELPIAPAVIGDVLEPGHEVLIDDGLVRLRVDEVEAGRASCAVVVGGLVYVYDPTGGGIDVYRPNSANPIAKLPGAPGHWNSPIVVDGHVIEPEGDANDHSSTGTIDLFSVR